MIAGFAGRAPLGNSARNVARPTAAETASRGRTRIWSTTVFARLGDAGSGIAPPAASDAEEELSDAPAKVGALGLHVAHAKERPVAQRALRHELGDVVDELRPRLHQGLVLLLADLQQDPAPDGRPDRRAPRRTR